MSYFAEASPDRIAAEYPVGEAFLRDPALADRERLRARQCARLERVLERAWQVPFYRRRWEAAGLAPGDVRTPEDLSRVPPYRKSDLMAAVEAHPPWGDYHGMADPGGGRFRTVLHTTSGTTGSPQPLYFGAFDREVQNRLLARAYRLQGLTDDDVVHSVYGFGMVNGGHYIREAILHHTGAMLLPAGTGVETASRQQVELMRRFGATVIVGFADYVAHLADVARDAGLVPGEDLPVRLVSGHVDHRRRDALSRAWGGAEVLDWYGVGDTGVLAAEGPERDGLHVFEDAHILEIIDPDDAKPVAEGEPGNVCVTALFKDTVYPIVRFDTQDLSRALAVGPLGLRRLSGFEGRSDNMVKLRGVNVYPDAIGAHIAGIEEASGEYLCRVGADAGGERMQIDIECAAPRAGLGAAIARRLREKLGVRVEVVLVAPGATAAHTGVLSRQKPRRLIDER